MAFVYWIHLPEHLDMFTQGYVGITSKSVKTRMHQHKSDAKRKNRNLPLRNAINKYGDKIIFRTILEGSLEYCQEIERKLRPSISIGWNVAIGGASPRLGSLASDETKRKLSISNSGRKHSEETKARISAASKIFRHSDEAKAKMSNSRKGIPFSQERREKLKGVGKGRVLSEETKIKLKPYWDLKTFSDVAKAAALVYLKNLKSWEVHNAKKDIWLCASDMCDYLISNPRHGSKRLANAFGFKECSVMGILKKLRTGWLPSKDESWLAFKIKNELADNEKQEIS